MNYYEVIQWNDGEVTKVSYDTLAEAVAKFNITVSIHMTDDTFDAFATKVIDSENNVYRRHEEFR